MAMKRGRPSAVQKENSGLLRIESEEKYAD